jgi:C-terminal processing protease CtpA/Prc
MNLIRGARLPQCLAMLLSVLFAGAGTVLAQESPRIAAGLALDVGVPARPKSTEQLLDILSKTTLANNQLVTRDFLVDLYSLTDELLGASLRPIDEVLRAQLEVPAKLGLLVAALRADGAAALAGLRQNDVLLTLADKPLASSDDLTRLLKEAGKSVVPLKLLRAGKPVTLQIQPHYKVTLAPATQLKTEYFIGVSLEPVDEALRSQLGISPGRGVVISDVTRDSPAEKAGLKKNDLVIGFGDTGVGSPEAFAQWVQQNKDLPCKLTVLRAGKPMTVPITAAVRKAEAAVGQELARLAILQGQAQLSDFQVQLQRDPAQRLDRLEKELAALRDAVTKLTESIKRSKKE